MISARLAPHVCAAAVLGLVGARSAGAQPHRDAPMLVEPAESQSSVGAIADAVAMGAAQSIEPADDVAVSVHATLPPQAPVGARRALCDALAAAIATHLREAHRGRCVRAVAIEQRSEAAASAARERGFEALVEIALDTEGNFIRASGAVWRGRAPARAIALALRARLDGELRRYAGPLPRLSETRIDARPIALPARGYVAMVGSDLDGDGKTELVLARADAVDVVRVEQARGARRAGLVTVGTASARGAAIPVAPSRVRRAIGTAISADRGRVIVRTSELAAPFEVALAPQGRVAIARARGPCPDDRYPLPDACAIAAPARDYFVAGLTPQGGSRAVDREMQAPAGFYARARRIVRGARSEPAAIEAVVTPAGRLVVRVGERRTSTLGFGAALALADVDADGSAEVLCSAAVPVDAGADRLVVLRVREDGQVVPVWRSAALEGNVLVAAAADVDADGMDELVAIEEPTAVAASAHARLWVVQ